MATAVAPASPVHTKTAPKRATKPDKAVAHLYKVIQKSTGAVGGYGHNGPVYGEITMGTFQKVVDILAQHTEFDASSSFIDIGSGLGKPNLHVALNPGVRLSYGVELESLRWQLSMHNLRYVVNEVPEMRKSVVYFAHDDATNMVNFEPFTHVYMFDVGFPPAVLISLANAFNLSKTCKALVSFQRPDKIMSVYGFGVELITQIPTRMNGSSETHTAYIYGTKRATEKPRRQLQLDQSFARNTPIKEETKKEKEGEDLAKKEENPPKESSSPRKQAKKKNAEKVEKQTKVTTRTTKAKTLIAVTPKKPTVTLLEKLQAEDYTYWVTNTGVIGGEGKRPQRTRKQVEHPDFTQA